MKWLICEDYVVIIYQFTYDKNFMVQLPRRDMLNKVPRHEKVFITKYMKTE